MRAKTLDVVFLIFLFVFVFRLFFVLQTENFSDNDSYYGLRYIENIANDIKYASYDELSYGGREILELPIFFYVMAFFESLFGRYALKIAPEFFISLFVFAAYFLAKKITENNTAAYFAALCSAFIPIFVLKTLNNLSIYSIVFPLFFLIIYAFYRIEEKSYLILFIVLSFLLPIIHPISFLLAIAFVIYIILCYVENVELAGIKKEAILLFVIVTFLANFIIYRDAFSQIGLGVIWQNIPRVILSEFFKDINLLDAIVNVGLVPLVFGITGIYFAVRSKHKDVFVLVALCITTILLLALKLLNFSIGLMFFGVTLSIVAAMGFDKFLKYIMLTKISGYIKTIELALLLLVAITLITPSIIGAMDASDNTLKEKEIEPYLWIKNNTALSATILADIDEGNLVTGIANRKSVYDLNFLLVKNVNKIIEEGSSLFTLESEVKALELITKYDVDYIYLSENTKKKYNIRGLKYSMDEKCFEKVFENEYGEIIKIIC